MFKKLRRLALTGAAGAAVKYFTDPARGEQRRAEAQAKLRGALDGACNATAAPQRHATPTPGTAPSSLPGQ